MKPGLVNAYLEECRGLVREEIESLFPRGARRPALYDLVLEYPLRAAKALRPALCIAACRALGGRLHEVLRSAAVLELFHNAFLVHDDIEDGSLLRRGGPTLHEAHGVPIAINVGDAMFALALGPLLDNTRLLDLGKALRILEVVARMARESVEGQAVELEWIRDGRWDLGDRDYLRMVFQKTCWYTFIAPAMVGGIAAGADGMAISLLRRFTALLGVAFQIQDDVLNLVGDEGAYGKEIAGDLWEGKRTLLLLGALRAAAPEERGEALRVLALPRQDKREAEVSWLRALVIRRGGVEHARRVAHSYARRAEAALQRVDPALAPSTHRDFLCALTGYVIQRDR